MSQTFVGDIEVFGFNFAPEGWFLCNGQLVPISQYEALYALIGTTYGGDGQSTFAVPDLRGRAAVHYGQGQGLSNYTIGQTTGVESVTLLTSQMPSHNHLASCVSTGGTAGVPTGNTWAKEAGGNQIYSSDPSNTTMSPQSIGLDGGSQPHDNIPPVLAMNYCICWAGIYPQQS
jgi:microcystin-dependent protein